MVVDKKSAQGNHSEHQEYQVSDSVLTMPPKARSLAFIYSMTCVMWLICVVIHAVWHINQVLIDPSVTEYYAKTIDFQLLVFALFRLPIWIIFLLGLILIEYNVIKIIKTRIGIKSGS